MLVPIDLHRPTYIVLELPAELATMIREMRARYRPDYVSLPVEITLIGSSGAGVLEPAQSDVDVIARVNEIARCASPLKVGFDNVETFPRSGVYFFPPVPREPFDMLHSRLLEAGIRCQPSRFPFRPHLTIARIKSPTLGLRILTEAAPAGDFTIDHIAIYSQVGFDTQLHYRARLRGAGA
jgi:2'-5' RNA ligase